MNDNTVNRKLLCFESVILDLVYVIVPILVVFLIYHMYFDINSILLSREYGEESYVSNKQANKIKAIAMDNANIYSPATLWLDIVYGT